MARRKTLKYASANIVLHPHSPELYVALFRRTHELKSVGFINKNRRARIGSLVDREDAMTGLLSGLVYFYTVIDPDQRWLDDMIDDVAEEDELEELRVQAQRFHPELRFMRFYFDPQSHTLFFEHYNEERVTFSPRTVQKAFEQMFNHPVLTEEFSEAEVTVIPTVEAITHILNLPGLRKLIIDLQPPNADDHDGLSERIMGKMDAMHAKRWETTLTRGDREEALVPAEDLRDLAQVAAANGQVKGVGYDGQKKVEESTRKHPQIDAVILRESEQSAKEAFRDYVRRKLGRG